MNRIGIQIWKYFRSGVVTVVSFSLLRSRVEFWFSISVILGFDSFIPHRVKPTCGTLLSPGIINFVNNINGNHRSQYSLAKESRTTLRVTGNPRSPHQCIANYQ